MRPPNTKKKTSMISALVLGTCMSRGRSSQPESTTPIAYLSGIGYTLGKVIGEGSYCKVRIAKHERKQMAVKIISRKNSPEDFVHRFLPRELAILNEIKHPSIVQTYRIIDFQDEVYIFMELAENGDLLNAIQTKGPLPEATCRRYFKQLVDAITYLHSKEISHRDLKCENVLLNKEDKIKLTDFGFCRKCVDYRSGKRILSKTYCGSAAYAAPEVLMATPYNPKMYDVWSLGCILFVMATSIMPFDDTNICRMIATQMRGRLSFPPDVAVSYDCKSLIRHMLEPDITRRATISQVLRHRWLQN